MQEIRNLKELKKLCTDNEFYFSICLNQSGGWYLNIEGFFSDATTDEELEELLEKGVKAIEDFLEKERILATLGDDSDD